jgi:hypothetical protein
VRGCNNAFKRNDGRFGLKIKSLNQKLEHSLKKSLPGFFDKDLLQLIDCERFLSVKWLPSMGKRSGRDPTRQRRLCRAAGANATFKFHARRGPTGGTRVAAASPGAKLQRAGSHVPASVCQSRS